MFGFTRDDVDFAFVDLYTVSHFIFGYITYLIIYLFMIFMLPKYPDPYWVSITIAINIGIFWEFLENFYLVKKGYKFDDRVDSFANSLTDVLFVDIGAIVCAILSVFEIGILFMGSLITLILSIILYEILRKITFNGSRKNGN